MNVPTFDQLLQPTINALHDLGGVSGISNINDHVIEQLHLPEDLVSSPHITKQGTSAMTELEYRLHWARSYLKRCGLILNEQRGVWSLTALGMKTQTVEPEEIVRTVQEQLRQERKAQAKSQDDTSEPAPITETIMEEAEVSIEKEVESAATADIRSPTPDFPLYSQTRYFLHIIEGISYARYRSMYNEIWGQRGNPQEQVDWADPDEWIVERLYGEEKELARKIWIESKKSVNPRYVRGIWYLATKHNLLARNETDQLQITPNGHEFLTQPDGEVVAVIDDYEGVLVILRLIAERGPGKRSDFLAPYREYCHTSTATQG